MYWGYVKSKDFVYWEYLFIVLVFGDVCDINGCFLGSVVDNDGELMLIYIGYYYVDKEKDLFY